MRVYRLCVEHVILLNINIIIIITYITVVTSTTLHTTCNYIASMPTGTHVDTCTWVSTFVCFQTSFKWHVPLYPALPNLHNHVRAFIRSFYSY